MRKKLLHFRSENCTKFIHFMNFTPFLNHGFYIYNHSFVNCEHDLQLCFTSFQGYEVYIIDLVCLEKIEDKTKCLKMLMRKNNVFFFLNFLSGFMICK